MFLTPLLEIIVLIVYIFLFNDFWNRSYMDFDDCSYFIYIGGTFNINFQTWSNLIFDKDIQY